MNAAVNFYYEFRFRTIEIRNEKPFAIVMDKPYRVLPENFLAEKISVFRKFPELFFGGRRLAPQLTGRDFYFLPCIHGSTHPLIPSLYKLTPPFDKLRTPLSLLKERGRG